MEQVSSENGGAALRQRAEQRFQSSPALRRTVTLTLRALSLGVAYGLWRLTFWIHTRYAQDSALGVTALVGAGLMCAFFIFLGALAPSRLVIKIWKALGIVLLYILSII